ncbi:ATP-dependent kinase-like protein notR' [Populus trichocarpa]|uniref:ATP-dependent kinase-like protein notR' n=1 Tax=Populus trichocarpa TaxID=3694 RepID=UPI002278AE96|nr:ATP-dependent kinase-like protein notR' [Populus trichocarpa]
MSGEVEERVISLCTILDHGVGDPEEDGYLCEPSAYKVVIAEGNYILLEDGAWKDVSSMFDEKWFIDVDIDTERQIVLKRHISKGMGSFSVFTGYCSYSSTRERKESLVILILCCLTGKPPDVSKWRAA